MCIFDMILTCISPQKKANLQSVLEDEQMKNEIERIEYEKEKALMKTKLKQAEEYSKHNYYYGLWTHYQPLKVMVAMSNHAPPDYAAHNGHALSPMKVNGFHS